MAGKSTEMSKAIIYHKIPVDLLIIIVLFSHSIVSKYVLPASVAETDSAANSRVGPAADADLGTVYSIIF